MDLPRFDLRGERVLGIAESSEVITLTIFLVMARPNERPVMVITS
jgi:hypothetical protein